MRSALRMLGLSVYLPSSLMAVAQMALLVVLPLYVLDLGRSLSVAALVFAMRDLGSVVVNVPASLVIERHGHRAGMLLGNGLMAVSALAIAGSASTLVLALATLLFGAGMGTWLLARLAFITERVPTRQRGTAMAGLAGIQRLGMVLGPLLGAVGAEQFGFPMVFLAIAGAALLTTALIRRMAPARLGSHAPGEAAATGRTRPAAGVLTLLPRMLDRHRRIFLGAGVFAFCVQLVREQRRLLVVLWGTAIGIDVEVIGLIVSSASVVELAMFPVAGYVMDTGGGERRGGLHRHSGNGDGASAADRRHRDVPVLVMLAGIGNGLGSGIVLTLGADLAPADDRSRFLACGGWWATAGRWRGRCWPRRWPRWASP